MGEEKAGIVRSLDKGVTREGKGKEGKEKGDVRESDETSRLAHDLRRRERRQSVRRSRAIADDDDLEQVDPDWAYEQRGIFRDGSSKEGGTRDFAPNSLSLVRT
jgi:hypothetical protein